MKFYRFLTLTLIIVFVFASFTGCKKKAEPTSVNCDPKCTPDCAPKCPEKPADYAPMRNTAENDDDDDEASLGRAEYSKSAPAEEMKEYAKYKQNYPGQPRPDSVAGKPHNRPLRPSIQPKNPNKPRPVKPGVIVIPTKDKEKPGTEQYDKYEMNKFKNAAEHPFSTFAMDVDTASYTVMRSKLKSGVLPPKESVRVEEYLNFFKYNYPAPV